MLAPADEKEAAEIVSAARRRGALDIVGGEPSRLTAILAKAPNFCRRRSFAAWCFTSLPK